MKKILLSVLMFASFSALTQSITVRKKLGEESNFTVYQSVTNGDTSCYYYFSFQNQKYSHITDLGSILLSRKSDVLLLSDQLKELSEVSEKVSMTMTGLGYSVSLYDFSNLVFLSDSKGKYTSISKKQALKMSEALLVYIGYLKN